ncbi:sigma-70 family RNA polymerase sigma factor [Aneurinibacillus thermoaerophilus]|jgi:RNA polymerase sigma factor (sigma-70 family)|uniref:sigma-70 family RNA polymerase sigma factor n=1 Tax=Aneurinibacillus thermoaerophilus TaxID=143495 RepID=UPI002E22F18E|nr:sigma-70 family RNA polymerase sigma factor [Aneurinibacillus thermoaerophilus]MED0680240.1 sigma-70 family RNA polymerase sigma factor [Aneurinibacillus thermoaerophilus]MED0765516.1 sigma-70 family RNA polymerase sigma factor [Aneurinibacillus thermoaerophilus]
MEQLKKEYSKAIYQLKKLREEMNEEEKKAYGPVIGSMISDLRYALEWLNTGRRPGNRRGVERLAAYQREKPFDPLSIQQYFDSNYGNTYGFIGSFIGTSVPDLWGFDHIVPTNKISKHDEDRIADALSVLTEREKEIYVMSRGRCLPYKEIAHYLKISEGTVKATVYRAEKKISKYINGDALVRQCG